MNAWNEPDECRLCHHTGSDGLGVRLELVQWLEALPGMRYEHISRCQDRAACRVRVEAAGEKWPVMEPTR